MTAGSKSWGWVCVCVGGEGRWLFWKRFRQLISSIGGSLGWSPRREAMGRATIVFQSHQRGNLSNASHSPAPMRPPADCLSPVYKTTGEGCMPPKRNVFVCSSPDPIVVCLSRHVHQEFLPGVACVPRVQSKGGIEETHQHELKSYHHLPWLLTNTDAT